MREGGREAGKEGASIRDREGGKWTEGGREGERERKKRKKRDDTKLHIST